MIPILILAAGQSTRMRGRDKLLEPVSGQPLLRLLASRALTASREVFVALPAADSGLAPARRTALDDLGVTTLFLADAAEGMSGTLRAAVANLPPSPAFMLILGDMPAITAEDMTTVIAAGRDHPDYLIWRGATAAGVPGHPVVFSSRLRPRFASLTGDNGGASIVSSLRDETLLVPLADDRARLDLDTPEEWDQWRKALPS